MRKKDIRKVEKWKTSKLSMHFRLAKRGLFENMWLNLFVLFLSVVVCGLEFGLNRSLYSFVPVSILYCVFFLWWLGIPERDNDTIVSMVIHDILDDIVEQDVRAIGTNVIKSMVNYDTKGTYGIITASCLLVLLDNGDVWEYPFDCRETESKGVYVVECKRDYTVSTNQQHIRKINPKCWNRFNECFKLSKRTLLGGLLATIIIVGCLIFFGSCYLVTHFKWQYVLVVFGYVCIYIMMKWLSRRRVRRGMHIVENVISLPIVVFYLLVQFVMPFITIVGTYFFVVLFAFGLPATILIGFNHFGWLAFRLETIIFVVFTMGSIICSHCYGITKWIVRSTPLRDWGNHTYESYREQLAIYLIHPSNVVFLLYLIYFVFLLISGYLQVENGNYLISKEIDESVLKAFLVFIAFTNMRIKAKDAEFDVLELYQRTLKHLYMMSKYTL